MLIQLEIVNNGKICHRYQLGFQNISAQAEQGRPDFILFKWDETSKKFSYYFNRNYDNIRYETVQCKPFENIAGFTHLINVLIRNNTRFLFNVTAEDRNVKKNV